MLKKTRSLLPPLALLCFILCGSGSWATAQVVPIGDGILDIEYTVGIGSNISYVVVDFGGSPASNLGPGESYAFGYRWEGEATAADALLALSDAPSVTGVTDVLDFDFTVDPNFGLGTDRLAYLEDDDTPVFLDDSRFWNFYQGSLSASDVSWSLSGVGVSSADLFDGSFSGFRAQEFGSNDPVVPVAAVPEPNSALCWLIATRSSLIPNMEDSCFYRR